MTARTTTRRGRVCLFALWCATVASAAVAQSLPTGPLVIGDGRLTLGGDVSASFGSEDPAFFDYTDYDHSALRMVRLNISAAVKAGEHLAVLGDVQTANLDYIRPYALYVRIHPWTTRGIDIQVGRVPPTFGAFGRRTYASDNPLIGYPLAYQYLTTLRPDALPGSADELLQKKGVGWLVRYSVGDPAADHGVPLMSSFRWDTGVQVHAAMLPGQTLHATASLTTGTLSNPRFGDDNGGRQAAGRVEWRPAAALTVGGSFARGEFVSDGAARAATGDANRSGYTQTAWGADVEYSRDYVLVRAETIVSDWRIPFARQPALRDPLRAAAASLEGRYRIQPGLYAAARMDYIGFSRIVGATNRGTWDAPVARLEIGGGYSIQRNLLAKVSFQRNTRDGGRLARRTSMLAAQLVYWF